MNASVPSPDASEARQATAPASVEPGIVEIRYADYRLTWADAVVPSVLVLLGYAALHVPNLPTQFMLFCFAIAWSNWAFGIVWPMLRFRKAGPAITLDADGLHSTPWFGHGVDVRWHEIEWCDAFLRGGKVKYPYLGIRLKHPERWISRWSRPWSSRRPHIWILSEGLQLSTKDLVGCIRDYQARLGR